MRPMVRSPALATLLERHDARLGEAWTRALRASPDSQYRSRPASEIRTWVDRGLSAIRRSLATGDPAPLERHLERLVKARERLGFSIEEVLLGLARLNRCALPLLLEEHRDDPAGFARAHASLDECVDFAVARFGVLFARAMRDRVETERRITARLLEAIEAVAHPADLSSALAIAARHIRQALGATRCAVFIRQGRNQMLSLGASDGIPLPLDAETLLRRSIDLRSDVAVREVIEQPRPSVCHDDEQCCFFAGRSCRSLGLSSVVLLPVHSRGRPTALALATYDAGKAKDDAHEDRLRLAQAMASTLGSVIDNARLYAESQQNLAESGTLQQISTAMLEETSLTDMLDLICRESRRLLRASGALVLLRTSDDAGWRVAARSGDSEADWVRWLAENWENNGTRKAAVEPMLLDDASSGAREAMQRTAPSVEIPLAIAGQTVGLLHVSKERGAFGENDVALVERIAGQATLAIEHERLHREHEKAMIVQERHRLSRDLHDSVTQSIYSVTMFAEAAARLLEQGDREEALGYLRELGEISQQALWEMRLLIFELQPPDLDALGLESVLQSRLGTVERRAGLKTSLRCRTSGRLPRGVEHGLYRIAQEALSNAIRHARASRVELTLETSEDTARLVFEDDGIGFDLEEGRRKGGMGLRGMEQRAKRMGGSLTVDSRSGVGTRVELVVPLHVDGEVAPRSFPRDAAVGRR